MNRHKKQRWRLFSQSRAKYELKRRSKYNSFRKRKNLRPSRKRSKRVRGEPPQDLIFNKVSAANPLSLFGHFLQSNEFFQQLEEAFKRHTTVYIDLETVEEIGVECILVLLALIKRYTKNRRNLKIRGNSPKEGTQAAKLLYDSGYYEEFSSIYPQREPSGRVCRMQQRKGFKVATELASDLALDAGKAILGVNEYPLGVYPTIIEAMGNTREHANPKVDAGVRWWIMLFIDKDKGCAHFVVYDGGIGILGSLRSRLTNWFASVGFGVSDEDIVHDIMHGQNKSRTKLPYRGKGLPAMAKAIERKQIRSLKVLSNKVMADVELDSYNKLESSFSGTLLYWQLVKL